MAQSSARRLNFWNDQPAPATLGTRISVRSSSGAEGRLQEPGEELGGGDGPLPARAPGDERPAEGEDGGRQVGGRVAVGQRAADRAPVADLGVADEAGHVGQDRHLGQHVAVSTSRWRVRAPMATWSPPSRT